MWESEPPQVGNKAEVHTGLLGAFWPYHLADFARLNRISPCNETHSEYRPRLITPQAREHAACTVQPGINIHLSSWYNKTCRHKGLLIKRLHSDPSEQHNEWGVTTYKRVLTLTHTHTHAHTHTLKASLQLSNPISVWLLVSFCSRLLKASPEPGGNASHTLICHYRETAVQPAESEQSGRGGREKKARRRARVHVRVTRDGWLVCMYKMCRRGFVHVCGRGWVGERGGMCLCVRSGANTAGAGWGFVDQQPMTGCHTLTHRAPKSSPVWGASVRPSLTLWDGPESNPAITPTQPTRRENTGSCQHNEKRSLSLLTFAEAPLFRVWGVGRGGGSWVLGIYYNSMRAPFCFFPSQESILTSDCWHKEKAVNASPLD